MTRSTTYTALLAAALSSPILAQHLERPGDAYRAGPTPNATTTSRSIITRGPFRSIQVNVNTAGNNITGDAANEPSLAINPTDPDNIVVGWRQFDNVQSNFRQAGYGRTTDGGDTWRFPGSLEPGNFNSDPVIDTDRAGNFYYLGYPGGTTLTLFRSSNQGVTWTNPLDFRGGDKAWMIVDKTGGQGDGHIYSWWQVVHGPEQFIRSIDGGASFQPAIDASPENVTFGTMAINNAGTLFVGGLRSQNLGVWRMARSTNAKNPAVTPTFATASLTMGGSMDIAEAPNPGGLMGQAEVATDPSRPNNVYMLASVNPPGGDPMDVHFVRSTNGGFTFSAPIRINKDPANANSWQWMGTMSCSPNGRIDAVWNDTSNSGNAVLSETHYAFSLDAGATWSNSVPIGPQWNSVVGHPNQAKIGDYYDLVSDNAKAHLAYATTYNGEQDVFYAQLGDCNDNGVHDGVDIRDGTSFDSNANTIPDECETCQPDLGFGNSNLVLSVCGDDLTDADSAATLLLDGGQPGSALLILISPGRFTPWSSTTIGSTKRLGSQSAGRVGEGSACLGKSSVGLQRGSIWRQEGFAGRRHCPWRLCGR